MSVPVIMDMPMFVIVRVLVVLSVLAAAVVQPGDMDVGTDAVVVRQNLLAESMNMRHHRQSAGEVNG
jgi:hypothetical protein